MNGLFSSASWFLWIAAAFMGTVSTLVGTRVGLRLRDRRELPVCMLCFKPAELGGGAFRIAAWSQNAGYYWVCAEHDLKESPKFRQHMIDGFMPFKDREDRDE